MTHGQGAWGGGQTQAPVWIRIESATMAGQHGPRSMKLPIIAQAGEQKYQLQEGDNPLPLPPGVWPLRVWSSYYGMKVGRAEITVDTRAGQPVLLYYMPPHTIYNSGVLSYHPAERQGKSTVALIYVMAFVVVAVAVVLAAALSG